MKDLKIYLFLVLAFLVNHCMEQVGLSTIWLRSYLDDLLAVPLVLKTALLAVQLMVPHQTAYKISLWDNVATVLVFGVYFELLLPHYNLLYTQDNIDFLCYSGGGIFFHYALNSPLAPKAADILRLLKRSLKVYVQLFQQQDK